MTLVAEELLVKSLAYVGCICNPWKSWNFDTVEHVLIFLDLNTLTFSLEIVKNNMSYNAKKRKSHDRISLISQFHLSYERIRHTKHKTRCNKTLLIFVNQLSLYTASRFIL